MPFNELKRRDSWPPTILHLSPESSTTGTGASPKPTDPEADLSNIDENPISFFLTSPEEDEDLYFQEYYGGGDDDAGFEDLSAGIEGSPESKALEVVREVSPSSLQRASLLPTDEDEDEYGDIPDDELDIEFGLAIPISLKDFTQRHLNIQNRRNAEGSSGRTSRASQHFQDEEEDDDLKGLGIDIPIPFPFPTQATATSPPPSPPTKNSSSPVTANNRGRPKVRLIPNNGRGRGKTRSLSAGRTKSWRLPSPDIWSIDEQEENELETEDTTETARPRALPITGNNDTRVAASSGTGIGMGLSLSAPPTTSILQGPMAPPPALVAAGQPRKKKPKKRVHWAL